MEFEKKPIACLILQRNDAEATKHIIKSIKHNNAGIVDFYCIESGSDDDKIINGSEIKIFHANWDDAKINGLRVARGFNYGMSQLQIGLNKNYKYYFLLTGDVILDQDKNDLKDMMKVFENIPEVGIVSALSPNWGADLKREDRDVYFVHLVPHVAFMIRHEFFETVKNLKEPHYMNYFYDGSNFRSYDVDTELVLKGYCSGYATAITSKVLMWENRFINAIVEPNKSQMIIEGLAWLKEKYGFDNKQQMRAALYAAYYQFFKQNSHLREYIL